MRRFQPNPNEDPGRPGRGSGSKWIVATHSKLLPEITDIRFVAVCEHHMIINQVIIPIDAPTKGFLEWLKHTAFKWCKKHPDKESRRWLLAIMEALEDRISGS